jgi:release factor glutamine methyltransferase
MPEREIAVPTIITRGTERLRLKGIDDPRREALRIWSESGGDRWAAFGLGDGEPSRAAVECFERAIERRTLGEPLAYITGSTGFRHLSLLIDRRALIPRPETEGLIDLLLDRVRTGVAADIGTGTGCLALSLALEGAFTLVIGIDHSREAISLADSNVRQVRMLTEVRLLQGDLCGPLRPESVDALVCNPPYLTVREYAALEPSVRDWEPASALVGGPDGMMVTNRLLREATSVVRPGGWIALEVDCSRAEPAAHRATELGWEDVSMHRDLFGRERYLLARRSDRR